MSGDSSLKEEEGEVEWKKNGIENGRTLKRGRRKVEEDQKQSIRGGRKNKEVEKEEKVEKGKDR